MSAGGKESAVEREKDKTRQKQWERRNEDRGKVGGRE